MTAARRFLAIAGPPVAVFIVVSLAAEAYLRARGVPKFLVPTPSAVFNSMWQNADVLLANLRRTASAALLGFAASMVIGILIAIALSSARWVRRAFVPYTVFFQTVPVVALAPMLVIWFDAGLQSVAICAFIVSVFPVITNTLAGLLSTDPALVDLFRLYGAGRISALMKLRLPAALPNIITGLRVSAGLCVIGAIVGEFVASELQGDAGLGVMVATSARYGNTDQVFAAVIAAAALGLAMLSAINLTGHLLLRRWHASAQG